jgi:urease accessory protein
MNLDAFLGLLQFSDGLFPAGSYAHSFGLESYVAEGIIRDAGGVESFLLSYLQGSVAPTDVVAAIASRKAALPGQFGGIETFGGIERCAGIERRAGMERCADIDRTLDALKPASELRDASRQMGRQVLRVASNLSEPFASQGLTADLFRAVENQETPGHHAMAFGVVGAAFAWTEKEMACAYLYATCAGLAAAALRLLALGQLAGQRILWALAPSITKLAEDLQGKDMADVWSFAPGIEIAAMRHATLDARLFRS